MTRLRLVFLGLTAFAQLSLGQNLTDSLVAYYPFNNNSIDESGHGNNGTAVGTTMAIDRFGNPNNAQEFANGSYVTVPHNPAFNISADMTISAWYKMQPGAIVNNMTIVDKRPENATFWGLYIERSTGGVGLVKTRMLFALLNNFSSLDYQYSNDTIVENVWSHVVVVVRNDTSMIYLNGIFDSASPIAIPRPTNTSPFEIGSPGGPARGESFVGSLDDIRIYNRAMSSAEVTQLYELEKPNKTLQDGLVAYYPFSGNAEDGSGNGNNGTVNGATLSADRFGVPNRAYHFDGTGSWIEIPNSPMLQPNAAVTVSAWIRIDSGMVSDSKTIVSKGAIPGVNADYTLIIDNSQTVGSMKVRPHLWLSDSWQYFNGATTLDSNAWYHVAMTYDGSTIKSYVNGVNDGSKSVASVIRMSNSPLRIGLYEPDTAPAWFPGQIDDIRIYNRALSDAEIAILFAEESLPITLSGFAAHWIDQSHIQLNWATMSEINNYGFEVQKSANATEGFQTIPVSFVRGHGTTNEPQHYSFTDPTPSAGSWFYRLKQIDLDGSCHYSDAIQVNAATGVNGREAPVTFSLSQNYPNPFNPNTTITYGLPARSHVALGVFNNLGQQIAVLENGEHEAGYHEVHFDGRHLASGVYFYRLTAGSFVQTRRLLLLK